jgi:uncharacterized peroxidase-related enzyme
MAFIELTSDDDATGATAELYEADRARLGYVANYTRLFAGRPAVQAAWRQLVGAIAGEMDARRYELATLAAARSLRSSYCMLAHGRVLLERFYDTETLREIADDHRTADLDEADVAVMDFAEKVTKDAASITQADVDRLRELGLSDLDVLDVTLAAAARCFFAKTNDALGIQPDSVFSELDPALRDALTVGRPIASG